VVRMFNHEAMLIERDSSVGQLTYVAVCLTFTDMNDKNVQNRKETSEDMFDFLTKGLIPALDAAIVSNNSP